MSAEDEELGAVKAAFDKILSRHPFETLDIFFYHIQVSEPSARAETLALLVEKLDRASETAGAKFQVYLLKKIKEVCLVASFALTISVFVLCHRVGFQASSEDIRQTFAR